MSKWKPVTSAVPQGTILGLKLFNNFISDTDSEIECTLSKSVDDAEVSGTNDTLEGKDAVQRDLDSLEEFKKAKCKVLHLGQGNPQCGYRLRDEWIKSSHVGKDLGI